MYIPEYALKICVHVAVSHLNVIFKVEKYHYFHSMPYIISLPIIFAQKTWSNMIDAVPKWDVTSSVIKPMHCH